MAEEKRREIPIEDDNAEKNEKEEQAEKAKQEAEDISSEDRGESAESAGEQTDEAADGSEEENGKSAEEQAAEQESERYMRLMAEFQNFKRRAAREKADIHAYANEKIVGEILPVLDNFERALSTDPTDAEAYAKGMDLIFQQLKTALEHAGLKEIPALGEEFDPNVHNAVMTEDSDEHDDGKISKVLQKGYTLNDKVIRPSMVAVVRK
jgi:molecular chaperone GrpE